MNQLQPGECSSKRDVEARSTRPIDKFDKVNNARAVAAAADFAGDSIAIIVPNDPLPGRRMPHWRAFFDHAKGEDFIRIRIRQFDLVANDLDNQLNARDTRLLCIPMGKFVSTRG